MACRNKFEEDSKQRPIGSIIDGSLSDPLDQG